MVVVVILVVVVVMVVVMFFLLAMGMVMLLVMLMLVVVALFVAVGCLVRSYYTLSRFLWSRWFKWYIIFHNCTYKGGVRRFRSCSGEMLKTVIMKEPIRKMTLMVVITMLVVPVPVPVANVMVMVELRRPALLFPPGIAVLLRAGSGVICILRSDIL